MSSVLEQDTERVVGSLERQAALPVVSNTGALMGIIERMAASPDFDVAKLDQMLAVKERWDKEEARKAFAAAMAAFKMNPPVILKATHVNYVKRDSSVVDYDHASLADLCTAVTPELAKHGLSHRWAVSQGERGLIKVTCVLTHEMGHSEQSEMYSEPDASGGKNSIQAIASATTYLERYTLFAVLGLSAKDMPDDDGRGAGSRTESGEEARHEARPDGKPTYPAEKFELGMKAWADLVIAGKKPDDIINTVSTKYTLTEAQQADIRGLKPKKG